MRRRWRVVCIVACIVAALLIASGSSAIAREEADHPDTERVRSAVDAVLAAKNESVRSIRYEEQKTGLPVARLDTSAQSYTVLTATLGAGHDLVTLLGADKTNEGWTIDDGKASQISNYAVNVIDARMDYTELKAVGPGGKVRGVGVYQQALSTICHLAIATPFVVEWVGAAIGQTWAWCDGIAALVATWADFYVVDIGVVGMQFGFSTGSVAVTALNWCSARFSYFWYITGGYSEFSYNTSSASVSGYSVPGNYLNCI